MQWLKWYLCGMILTVLQIMWHPSQAATLGEINAAIAQYNEYGVYKLKPLSQQVIDNLNNGKTHQLLEGPEGQAKTAIGCMLTDADLETLWIATQDTHFILETRTRSTLLEDRGNGDLLWYSHVDLPWPFKDRHWVNDTRNNQKLARATRNDIWETHWKLETNAIDIARTVIANGALKGLTVKQFDQSMMVERSIGGWVGIRLGDQSLYFMYTAFSPGGLVPDDIMTQAFYRGMPKMLKEIEEKALHEAKPHYTSDHAPQYGGNGSIIEPY